MHAHAQMACDSHGCRLGSFDRVVSELCRRCAARDAQEGEPSYKQFVEERDGILSSLKRRAVIMEEALNKLDGVSCNPAEGSMYVFPRIRLPKGALDAAKEVGHCFPWELYGQYAVALAANSPSRWH